MNEPLPNFIDDTGWQVPSHEVSLYRARRHAHALVIPVINEGERIRGQLARIAAAGLPVDVIVADGGSNDGSLDPDFVQSVGVRAVLTKTGPGKLSAQLRMAYAWCLKQGYAGIVTIDGNGKDGVEAVAAMVERLEAGCDYVQGSRYLPGGVAENTPLERTIANRLIHAPLLSLAGRHWFSDTTNGFRAYSARYLLHPEVRPFRDEFAVYGLLFYLTVRAGQLGLNVDQVPVERRYPDDGKVPTKIGGLASKLALLGETVFAATGGNTPDSAARRMPSLVWAAIIAALVALPLLLGAIAAPPYSPDSWAFWELAQSVFGDFYRFDHFRSYASASPFSSAFPPLWPVLIALTDAAFGTGARTGLFLAFAAFIGFATVSEAIGRRASGAAWAGLAAALILLLGPQMLASELQGGRTIPLQLLLYALVLRGLLEGTRIGALHAAGIGLVAGLAVMNRFDAAGLPVLVAAMIAWLTGRPSRALIALGTAALPIVPWVAYSLAAFGTVFATDNAAIATTLDPQAFVTDWWPAPQPRIADDPLAWALRVMGNMPRMAYIGASLAASPLGLGFAAAIAPIIGLVYLAERRPGSRWSLVASLQRQSVLVAFVLVMGTLLAPQLLTGYFDYRYFTALFWAGFVLVAVLLVDSGASVPQRRVLGALIAFPQLAIAAGFTLLTYAPGQRAQAAPFDAPADVRVLQQCLDAAPKARVLVLGDDNFAARAGALGGLHTMMEPRNLVEGRLAGAGRAAFVATWRVDYVLVQDPARDGWARARFPLVRVVDCPLQLYQMHRPGSTVGTR